jgi:hypothetical protein
MLIVGDAAVLMLRTGNRPSGWDPRALRGIDRGRRNRHRHLDRTGADRSGRARCPLDQVELRIGDSALPPAAGRRRFSGISNWGASIPGAADRLRDQLDSQYG